MYRFTPTYILGKHHVVPDCLSRRSDSPIAGIVEPAYADHLGPPSWVAPPPGGAKPTQVAKLTQEELVIMRTYQDAQTHQSATFSDNKQQTAQLADEELHGLAMSSLASLQSDPWACLATGSISAISPQVLSWPRLEAAARESPTYNTLHSVISQGAPEDSSLWPESVRAYFQYRHQLTTSGPVILLHDRPVIPVVLRPEVLEHLHASHAGVSHMTARANTCVFWPGMSSDITRTWAECLSCTTNAPSNPSAPPQPMEHPHFPFSSVCTDFFQVNGTNYLAVVDRYSGWLSIFRLAKDDSSHVNAMFRDYFATFGVPCILTSDGATVFTSQQLQGLLKMLWRAP